ncbi:MAG: helix-turn-helix domain-containing protein [Cyanobacteria bacterium RUI128]|nr:helix-turn-helix domain-containing protein [Cyanobacteria bacterium RUI128]
MEERALQFVTYYEKQLEIAKRFVSIRKGRKITQKRLSALSGVPYASIRRFEKSGDISLASLVKLALALQLYDDLDNLFKVRREYRSIEDVINDQKN